MNNVKKIYQLLYTRLRSFLIIHQLKKSRNGNYFVSRVSFFAPWCYVSYIPGVLCDPLNIKELHTHQNRQEMIAIVNILNGMGYNVYVQSYSSTHPFFPKINVKIVFGLEPVFEEACKHYPNAKKIYYATGAYYQFHNEQLCKYTDYVNERCHSHLPYTRYITPHNSLEIADFVLQIGCKYTIHTYPERLRDKITCIHQSTIPFPIPTIHYSEENEFFFLASEGNILKGTFLLIEYFCSHPQLTLHWVGPIEPDFLNVVKPMMTDNIKTYDFLRWDSDLMRAIVKRCNFMIYPSATDGTPGAVLCAMKCGLIPIVTAAAAVDEIEDLGLIISDASKDSIAISIREALAMTKEQISKLKIKNAMYATSTFNLKRFKKEFYEYFKQVNS